MLLKAHLTVVVLCVRLEHLKVVIYALIKPAENPRAYDISTAYYLSWQGTAADADADADADSDAYIHIPILNIGTRHTLHLSSYITNYHTDLAQTFIR